jgi:hypothetical protein
VRLAGRRRRRGRPARFVSRRRVSPRPPRDRGRAGKRVIAVSARPRPRRRPGRIVGPRSCAVQCLHGGHGGRAVLMGGVRTGPVRFVSNPD